MIEFRALGPAELLGPESTDPQSVLARPKLLGLLSFLAAGSARGFHRRDALIGLFWAELDQERARSAVRQSLYRLRQFLGEDVVLTRGDDEVALSENTFRCDVVAFEVAVEGGHWESALELYRGDFLEGLYVSDAPEYERWLDARRKELRQRASHAAWELADQEASERHTAAAGRWARQARELLPLDERLLRRVIKLLDGMGDRSGAVREYETFARRMMDELELEPSPETKALIDQVKARADVADEPEPLPPIAPGSEKGLAHALADRYTIEREIGSGGMASVYLARDVRHERDVAVKVMHPELAAAMGTERFLREIKIAAQLTHPHIVPLYDSGLADGFLYYVMPYIEGESLRGRLERDGQLPLDDALGIAREVADALSHAHSLGVVHRDIKPENILLSGGHALVADFGIARAVSAAAETRLTSSGIVVGTPPYMSPEQGLGTAELDGRSDVYSLGCVLYEMLAGQPPFTGPTAESVARQHLTTEPRPVTDIRPTVPESVASAILRALSKTPADRFHPVAHFADALGTVAPAAPMERRRIGRQWMMTAVGVAVVAVVAVVMLLRAGGAPGLISDRPMLAVLPFENLGPPEDEFFADGVTEEITSRLGEISGLGVVSRTSAIRYKGTTQALSDIADELGVQYVLEGTIRTDRAPDGTGQVRVTPQLIRATDDTHLWTERYTVSLAPGEVFGVQATIAEQVATALDVALLEGEQGALLRRPTEDPAAYDAYLRGRALWNRRTPNELQQAAGYFATAIAIDPEYVDAHVGLADAFAVFPTYGVPGVTRAEAFGRSEESARQALALDSMHAGAHASLANALMYARWDWEGAEREFERALSLDPDHAIAHYWYAELLTHTGRCEEALAHTGRAVELDPAVPVTHHLNGWVLLCLEQYDDAEVSERAALALGPGYFLAHANLGTIAWMRGDVETAQREWVASGMPGVVAQIIVDARRDPSRRAEAVGRLGALFRGGPPPDPAFGAYFYMLVGAIDSAVAWSERAVDARSDIFLGVLRLPSLRDALADPRMQDIVRRMGLEP